MDTQIPNSTVEIPISLCITTESVLVPSKNSEIYRSMKIDDKIIIPAKAKRQTVYNSAVKAFEGAKFITRKIDGKVYLIRIA
jgi:hypothetical protein